MSTIVAMLSELTVVEFSYIYKKSAKSTKFCTAKEFETNIIEKIKDSVSKIGTAKQRPRWMRSFLNIFLSSLWRSRRPNEIIAPRKRPISCIHISDDFNSFNKITAGENCDLNISNFQSLCDNMKVFLKGVWRDCRSKNKVNRWTRKCGLVKTKLRPQDDNF